MTKKLICIYFSATDTTGRYVRLLSQDLELPVETSINLADNLSAPLPDIDPDTLLILAAPVYGGRLHARVASRFSELHGTGAKAIAMVIFGNRDYDDALIELTDILSAAGFDIIGAGAFIARHSIFPNVAASRPDDSDLEKLAQFASLCRNALSKNGGSGRLNIKGNRPYKTSASVGLSPICNAGKCNRCGLCIEKCPVGAISPSSPCNTDRQLCMACGRCIHVCPSSARSYKGFKYRLISAIFTAAFSKRKEPDFTAL